MTDLLDSQVCLKLDEINPEISWVQSHLFRLSAYQTFVSLLCIIKEQVSVKVFQHLFYSRLQTLHTRARPWVENIKEPTNVTCRRKGSEYI